jgi:hypothetical protein
LIVTVTAGVRVNVLRSTMVLLLMEATWKISGSNAPNGQTSLGRFSINV